MRQVNLLINSPLLHLDVSASKRGQMGEKRQERNNFPEKLTILAKFA
jgi:hypothetical protein